MNVGRLGHRRARISGERQQPRAHALDHRQYGHDFGRFAGIRDGDQQVLARDHAQVPVAGLGRVHEKGGRTGAGQGCRDLVADMPRLAHACDDDASGRRHAQVAGGHEIVVQPAFEGVHGARLDVQNVGGQREQLIVCQTVRQWTLRPVAMSPF